MVIKYLSIAIGLLIPFFTNAQQTIGLFLNDSSAYDGYTLIAPNLYNEVYLIDNCGNMVHSWQSSGRPGAANILTDDGLLLRAERIESDFLAGGTGGKLLLLDENSEIVWSYILANEITQQHHDLVVMPNENILLTAWDLKTKEEAILAGRDTNFISDQGLWSEKVMEIRPIGLDSMEIVWEWSVWDNLIQEFDVTKNNYGKIVDHPELIDINYAVTFDTVPLIDWLHFNSLDYNEDLNQIIVGCRNFNEFWIIDHSLDVENNNGNGLIYRWGNPAAYQRGDEFDKQLYFSHNAHWIDKGLANEGKIMVFNNGDATRPFSTVEIISPELEEGKYKFLETGQFSPSNPLWIYGNEENENIYSFIMSSAQRQPNGNTLICVGREGKVIEINEERDIVWEYINPVTNGGATEQGLDPLGKDLFKAYKYPKDFSGLKTLELSPKGTLELEPILTNCNNMDLVSSVEEEETTKVHIYPNPVINTLTIEFGSVNFDNFFELSDLNGKIIYKKKIEKGIHYLDLSFLNSGLYILKSKNILKKIIKI